MKKVGIDARLYFQTGVGVYIRNLLHYLPLQSKSDVRFYVYMMENDLKNVETSTANFQIRTTASRWHSLSEQTTFLRSLQKDNLDLMHFTYFSYPIFYNRPFIATIHDLTPLLFKTGKASTKSRFEYAFKHNVFSYVLRSQVERSRLILTPSFSVKRQLLALYKNISEDKIKVTYEGVNFELQKAMENKKLKREFGEGFLVYVGNFYPHKNIGSLIEAVSQVEEIKLVLVGPDDFFAKRLKDRLARFNAGLRIRFYHNASYSDLVYLYRHASALINPSLSEGFGLPLIEASYFNLPVVASDIPVFREILKEGFIPFNPLDIDSIKKALIKLLSKKLPAQSINTTEKFSFKEMAKETYNTYLTCLQ